MHQKTSYDSTSYHQKCVSKYIQKTNVYMHVIQTGFNKIRALL